MEPTRKPPRIQLDRDAWIDAATEVLADEGIAGLRVEVLAKRLKVTKGSFYWHFRDRQDLLSGVLEQWRAGRIRDIIKQTSASAGNEFAQLHHILDVYSSRRNRRGMMIELAVRDWALRDDTAATVVAEVDRVRLCRARELFLACGVPAQEATNRCALLYAYVFGISLMNFERFDAEFGQLRRDIAGIIAPPSPSPSSAAAEDGGSAFPPAPDAASR